MKKEAFLILLIIPAIIILSNLVSAPGVIVCGQDFKCGVSDSVCPTDFGASCPTTGVDCDPDCGTCAVTCVPACQSGYTCKSGTCVPITCTCSAWTDQKCGGSNCSCARLARTRTCNPAGCAVESKCVISTTCSSCSCSSWTNQTCGGGTCSLTELYQTRTVSPKSCVSNTLTSQCLTDPVCEALLTCEINNVAWLNSSKKEITESEANEPVLMKVESSQGCIGKTLSLTIFEDDTLSADDFIYQINTTFDSVTKEVSWNTLYENEGGLDPNPEYYFQVASGDEILDESDNLDIAKQVYIKECGDNNIDVDETCSTCPDDAGCLETERCLINNDYADDRGCVDCSLYPDECDPSSECEKGCYPGLICFDDEYCVCNEEEDTICGEGSGCESIDPDCCEISSVYFDPLCSAGVGINGIGVDLVAQASSDSCNQKEVTFSVYIYNKDTESLELINTFDGSFENNIAYSSELFTPEFARGPSDEYIFTDGVLWWKDEFNRYMVNVSLNDSEPVSSEDDLTITKCMLEIDSDCDGVSDIEDQCPESVYCSETSSTGCSAIDSSCLANWDCSSSPWSECNENGFRERDSTQCVYTPSGDQKIDLYCSTDEIRDKLLSQQKCVVETAFPVFTGLNLIIVIFVLSVFYIFRRRISFFNI
ncbi:MAG: hypothetical protein PHT54_01140 [Candidatus Nanoarchaeia archaeon]|nr:hypothetical protein [Candidatus Nanoarchaeia archaeon]